MSLKDPTVEEAAVEPPAVTPADVRPRVRLSDGSAAPGLAPAVVERESAVQRQTVFQARDVSVNYGEKRAIEAVTMDIAATTRPRSSGHRGAARAHSCAA